MTDLLPPPPPLHDDAALRDVMNRVRIEVGKAVVGQDGTVTGLLIALLARGHVLLEGVPGVAKTLLVRSLSTALGLDTKRIQFTPDLMPGDVSGSLVYDARTGEFQFREGPIFTNIVLADEINRTPPKTQSALLEAMEERQVSTDGVTRPLPDPFLVAATQNPIEHEGTYTLPEAQLDRFLLKLVVDLPARDAELAVLRRHANGFDPRDLAGAGLRAVASADEITRRAAGRGIRHRLRRCARLRRRPRTGHAPQPLGAARRQPARRDGAARRREGVGVARRLPRHHARPRADDARADVAPPHPAAARRRTRGRVGRCRARLGAAADPRADLIPRT